MKLLVLGATGETGMRLARAARRAGHDVTAFARNRDKLAERLGEDFAGVTAMIGDAGDQDALGAAMRGQDVVINAAGNAWDGDSFPALAQLAIRTADAVLGPGGRFWMFGGAALLDIPGTKLMGVDLPGVPNVYQAHRANFEAVKATALDWSVLCPGPMIAAPDGRAHENLRLEADKWPVAPPVLGRALPRIALALAFARRLGELTITYEDAVRVVLDNLAPNGRFSRKRVGIALPLGMKLSKPRSG